MTLKPPDSVNLISGFGAGSTTLGFAGVELEGAHNIDTFTPTAWRGDATPARLRVSRAEPDVSGGQHFLVTPYEFGMAIEYNGLVECWVDEWSIHNNNQGGGDSGASLWVGNHHDTGGLHVTASSGVGQAFGRLTTELFSGENGGDLQFVLRDEDANQFSFLVGAAEAETERVRIDGFGNIRSRYASAEEVWIGAAGPSDQAGVGFGLATDIRLYRTAEAILRCNGKLTTDGGLGVGNSAAASSVGTVTKKMQVFDAAGASLGYVPIYDAIT